MTMMDVDLNAWLLFGHVDRHHGSVEVVSRFPSGEVRRSTYADVAARARRLMNGLDALRVGEGERVATLAWNHQAHLEAYIAIPCAARVLHTLNLRLSPAELGYIIDDADDRVIIADADLLPLLEQVHAAGGMRGVEHVVVLGDTVPDTALPNVVAYEQLLADQPAEYEPRDIPERTPLGICYTSGTTGRPKGVVYTHRSTFLHALGVSSAAGMGIGPQDCVLPVVPMFHAMAWGMPHAALAVGAKQVFLAGALDAGALVDLMVEEEVTLSGGVPTVWIAAADAIAARGGRLPALRHLACGGSQPPRALIERYLAEFGIPLIQAWGMTETSPLASMAWPRHAYRHLPDDEVTTRARTQAGLPIPGVDVSLRDADGKEVPSDGEAMGDLWVRGPWVAGQYWKGAGAEQFEDGWFRTGDVAVGSPDGYFVISDRSKDLIKSGGEWISSVDMEAAIMAMPGVVEAAVVAIPDERWQERPLACVVVRPDATVAVDDVRAHLESQGWARWQLPDRIELVDEIPRTSVGKFDKKVLRARFAGVATG